MRRSWSPVLFLALVFVAILLALPASARADWSPQNPDTTHRLHAVFFPDASHGWAVGNYNTIRATEDGGTTWAEQFYGGTTSNLRSVSFPDASRGWVVATAGLVLHFVGGSIGDLVWDDENGNGV